MKTELIALVKAKFVLDHKSNIHGLPHWVRVWNTSRALCAELKLDPKVPMIFSFIHDSCREDDHGDPLHGERAALWVDELVYERKLKIDSFDHHLLNVALRGHSFGGTDAHPIVQVCWDADRLDLGRCGIAIDNRLLCTDAAKYSSIQTDANTRAVNSRLLEEEKTMIPETGKAKGEIYAMIDDHPASSTLTGYKGHTTLDVGWYFAPYRPGMSDEEIAEVNARLAEANKGPTDLQKHIMNTIRGLK